MARGYKGQIREKIIGIYIFEAVSGNSSKIGWKYVGQSADDINKRKPQHLSQLRRNKHHSGKLQGYYNKYGPNSLRFSILHSCQKEELNLYEKFWVKCFDSKKNGFNETDGGNDTVYGTRGGLLQNMETGEIVKFSSIKEFCEQNNIRCQSMVSQVLDGKANFVDVWFNPDKPWRPKIRQLKDPNGNIHSFCKIHKFCDKHNLDRVGVNNLLNGSNIHHRGWTALNPREYNYESNEYSFISPNGEIFKGENITEFAKQQNLSQTCLNSVMNGKMSYHRGWRKYNDGDKITKFEFKTYEYKFVSPDGKLYITNTLRGFAREHGIEERNLHLVYNNKRKSCNGWRRYNEGDELKTFEESQEIYKFVSPEGKILETNNLSKFAKENNLKNYNLSKLFRGTTKNYQGWTKFKE